VTKVWKQHLSTAVNRFLVDLSDADANWPVILWKTYKVDGVNPSEELSNVLHQNVMSNMKPVQFESEYLDENEKEDSVALRKILSALCFTKVDDDESSKTGDIYKKSGEFYINIRPMCDCVERDGKSSEIYLLKCSCVTNLEKCFNKDCGNFEERSNEVIIGPICGLKENKFFYSVNFKNLKIVDSKTYEGKRLGRILPPYLTHIAERYALYIQRQGLPRTPSKAVLG
jgi:hypothetical protein